MASRLTQSPLQYHLLVQDVGGKFELSLGYPWVFGKKVKAAITTNPNQPSNYSFLVITPDNFESNIDKFEKLRLADFLHAVIPNLITFMQENNQRIRINNLDTLRKKIAPKNTQVATRLESVVHSVFVTSQLIFFQRLKGKTTILEIQIETCRDLLRQIFELKSLYELQKRKINRSGITADANANISYDAACEQINKSLKISEKIASRLKSLRKDYSTKRIINATKYLSEKNNKMQKAFKRAKSQLEEAYSQFTSALQSNNELEPSDSDDELIEPDNLDLAILSEEENAAAIPIVATTIPCRDRNIKGGELIKIVHDLVRGQANQLQDSAALPQVDLNDELLLRDPREWFMTLGRWKEYIPRQEIASADQKFRSVKLFKNPISFAIKKERIHLSKDFCIGEFEVTKHKRSTERTDLSYKQITQTLDHIKTYGISDPDIAQLQLKLLSRTGDCTEPIDDLPPEIYPQVVLFLDFLNALMFGIEATGLNAGLVTGLMTLDLIADGKLTYREAFLANKRGGIYPFACINNNGKRSNKGTFAKRESFIKAPSMKKLRLNPDLSPVAIKEAIVIKQWLKYKGITTHSYKHEVIEEIENAICNLISEYYFPDSSSQSFSETLTCSDRSSEEI